MQRLGYTKAMTFSEFVELTCELSLDSMDVHTQPQTFLISDSKGRLPDYIGCLENLKTDWERLSELMEQRGIPLANNYLISTGVRPYKLINQNRVGFPIGCDTNLS